uniref:Chemokine interleukin-8-like domain-containing protein n=1 Tax=Lates calcarifer TaxID=8187 RepID=A0A4W6E5N1_LATCA
FFLINLPAGRNTLLSNCLTASVWPLSQYMKTKIPFSMCPIDAIIGVVCTSPALKWVMHYITRLG